MPIYYTNRLDSAALAVWDITESETELLNLSTLSEEETESLRSTTHPGKRLELLAGKCTVKYLIEQSGKTYQGIRKDEFGKPFLIDSSTHISISHSFPYAAAIINPHKAVGIDMEKPKEKVKRIAQKFLSPEELLYTDTDLEKLCIFWAGKEAVYKEYGRKSLIFKEHIHIRVSGSNYMAILSINKGKREIPLELERVGSHILCYTN